MNLPSYQVKMYLDGKHAHLRCKCPSDYTGGAGRAHVLWCPAYSWNLVKRRYERTEGGKAPDHVPKLVQTRLDWITTNKWRGLYPDLVRDTKKQHMRNMRNAKRAQLAVAAHRRSN